MTKSEIPEIGPGTDITGRTHFFAYVTLGPPEVDHFTLEGDGEAAEVRGQFADSFQVLAFPCRGDFHAVYEFLPECLHSRLRLDRAYAREALLITFPS